MPGKMPAKTRGVKHKEKKKCLLCRGNYAKTDLKICRKIKNMK